jgi:single-stranded-DNA-specific exonuclease
MNKHWRFAIHDRGIVADLVRRLSCSPLLAQVLASRGATNETLARRFLSARLNDLHDPGRVPGVTAAAERVAAAVKAGRRVTIYGDYDVDGVTATSILWHCLKLAGAKVDYYIPNRLEEGYGLNLEAIRKLHAEDPQRLLITVDCGICSVEEARLARDLGLELIITDHHNMLVPHSTEESEEPGDPVLPEAACLVHPRLPGGDYPFPYLCGAGVAFKLAWGICQQLGDGQKASPRMRDYLVSAVGLAAIGTVADVVPLVDENRIIVRNGLLSLANRAPLGLATLMKVAGIDPTHGLTAEDIGFAIAPRLNAAGRLGQARLAVELLTTEDATRAQQLATYIDQLNKSRQTVERRMYKQARELISENAWDDHPALVLAHAEWHGGVMGIVASRVAETYQKPTVLISVDEANGIGYGSGRSFAGFDLHGALSHCGELLLGFGGHRAAAGLRISSGAIAAFRERFAAHVAATHVLRPVDVELAVDAEVSLADLTPKAVKELEDLGPFGCDHARPVFATSRVELAEPPQTMGNGDRHLSLKVRQAGKVMRAVAFGKAEWAKDLAACSGPISVCFKPGLNRYRGYENVELQLVDWQADDMTHAPSVRTDALEACAT